jgi:bacterioferritin (cytochrome b1)
MKTALNDNEQWIMNFYRISEISGAQFFARLARCLPAGPVTQDLTKHFADESMHAWYWTRAIGEMGYKTIRLQNAYQDAYLEAGGLPVNIMEVLALTNVFERRVISQYKKHLQVAQLAPVVHETIKTIMADEGWHIHWITQALKAMEDQFGKEHIDKTLARYKRADEEIYGALVGENQERLAFILDSQLQMA